MTENSLMLDHELEKEHFSFVALASSSPKLSQRVISSLALAISPDSYEIRRVISKMFYSFLFLIINFRYNLIQLLMLMLLEVW